MLYNIVLVFALKHESVIIIYVYTPFLLNLSPLPSSHFSRSSQNARLGSLCYIVASYQLYILHMMVYICKCYFRNSSFNSTFSKSGYYNYYASFFGPRQIVKLDFVSLWASLGLRQKAGDLGSIPGLGRSLGGGRGNPLQYSCLRNPMHRAAWQATVHRVAKGQA